MYKSTVMFQSRFYLFLYFWGVVSWSEHLVQLVKDTKHVWENSLASTLVINIWTNQSPVMCREHIGHVLSVPLLSPPQRFSGALGWSHWAKWVQGQEMRSVSATQPFHILCASTHFAQWIFSPVPDTPFGPLLRRGVPCYTKHEVWSAVK